MIGVPSGRALERSFAFEAGLVVQGSIELLFDVFKGLAATAQHGPGCLEKFIERKAGIHPAVHDRRE